MYSQAKLLKLCKRLKSELPWINKAILFGSFARGTATQDSDVDLLLLVNEKVSLKLERIVLDIIYPEELEEEIDITPLIVNQNDWDNGCYRYHPLRQAVENDGIVII